MTRARSTDTQSGDIAGRAAVPGRPAARLGPVSGVWRPRAVGVTVAGTVLLAIVGALNLGRGDFALTPAEVLTALAGGGDRSSIFVVYELRLPRILTGVLVGAALAVSGAITQTVARNPLASPDILGVTSGASASAVVAIALGSGGGVAGGRAGPPVAALVGGVLTAVLVYALAWRNGIDSARLVLVGVGIGAVAASITSWALIASDITSAAQATVWLTGSLDARGWDNVVPVAAALAVLVPVALVLSARLGVLQLGEDVARALGLSVERARGSLLMTAVGLAAVAVSGAGPITFVALVVPQIALRLVGSSRPPLLTSAVYGALLVVAADLVSRTLLPSELPVGIVTAVLGAPYLVHLLVRRHRGVNG